MTVYKSSSYYTLTEITTLKLFLHAASVRACVRGVIFSAFLRHKHPSVPSAQPAFAFLVLSALCVSPLRMCFIASCTQGF